MTDKDISKMQYCACGALRKITRVITQFYNKHIKSSGLCSPQCSLLAVIYWYKNVSVNEIAEILLTDQTTVTRNINVLKKHGYITVSKNVEDARIKIISLTDLGTKKIEEVIPLWEKAQQQIEQGLGKDRYNDFLNILNDIENLTK